MKTKLLRRALLSGALLLALTSLRAAEAIDSSSPQKLIETSSKALLADLDAHRATYRKDMTGLFKVIETQFLPHVDVPSTAHAVLGLHWREATPEQRKRFVDALSQSLLTTYGRALIDFTSDQLKISPFKGDLAAKRAEVKTTIRKRDGSTVSVDYLLNKSATGEWKVWDVVIVGVHFVKIFHDDFDAEINQKGLDALLSRLEHGRLTDK
jgi:phospholipid transport system substrate-binding protein